MTELDLLDEYTTITELMAKEGGGRGGDQPPQEDRLMLTCPECGHVFDLLNKLRCGSYGHDCEEQQ